MRHTTISIGYKRHDGRVHVEAVNGYTSSDGPVLAHTAAEEIPRARRRMEPVERDSHRALPFRSRGGTCDRRNDDPARAALYGRARSRATNGMHEAVLARRIVHPGDPMTAAHIGAVSSDGALRRRSSRTDIDAAVSVVLARYGALHSPRARSLKTG